MGVRDSEGLVCKGDRRVECRLRVALRMSQITSFRDLIAWQKAMDLVIAIYQLAESFPKTEIYRLVSQITRAAVSVPANIAEGNARGSTKDYARFVSIAKGSLMETETLLMVALRLRYVDAPTTAPTFALITEISKMLTVLRQRLT